MGFGVVPDASEPVAVGGVALDDGPVHGLDHRPPELRPQEVGVALLPGVDLDGNILTNTEGVDTITVEAGASLTVQDSSGDNSGTVDNTSDGKAAVLNNGTFILESGTLTRSVEAEGNSYYVFKNLGTATISGGIIKANTGNSSLVCNSSETQAATMTIEGGHIEQLSNGIAVKNDELGTLSITGGTIIGTGTAGQAVQNWNVATISDGDLTGDVTTWNYLNGGVSTTSQTTISGEAYIVGDVYSMKYVDDVTTDYDLSPIENPDVRITGGTITGSLVTGVGDLNKDHDWQELTPTADEDYDWMVISGGSFTNMVEDRFLADGFVLEGTDGNYGVAEANTVKFEVNVSGATISVTSADDSITYSPEDDGSYLLASGLYRVVVNAEGYQTWDKTVTISGDGTIEIMLSVEQTPGTIYESDQTVTVTADDGTVTVPVNGGPYSNVTLTVRFGGDSDTVNGTVTDHVTVSYAYLNAQGSDLALELSIDGVSDTDMKVTIRIPVELGDDEIIDPDSVYVYSIVGGVQTQETAYASGSDIIIVTGHNTSFYVSYDVMTIDTPVNPPIIPGGDDDDFVPPIYVPDDISSSENDTVKIVACAAAAVVAAIMAAFLIIGHRRD